MVTDLWRKGLVPGNEKIGSASNFVEQNTLPDFDISGYSGIDHGHKKTLGSLCETDTNNTS